MQPNQPMDGVQNDRRTEDQTGICVKRRRAQHAQRIGDEGCGTDADPDVGGDEEVDTGAHA
jgi:hypothetical protein